MLVNSECSGLNALRFPEREKKQVYVRSFVERWVRTQYSCRRWNCYFKVRHKDDPGHTLLCYFKSPEQPLFYYSLRAYEPLPGTIWCILNKKRTVGLEQYAVPSWMARNVSKVVDIYSRGSSYSTKRVSCQLLKIEKRMLRLG